jgi:carbon-monoxide dehydrogenase medium subunit
LTSCVNSVKQFLYKTNKGKEIAVALADVRLHTPQTLTEALALLSELTSVRLLAGGTDLLVDLKEGLAQSENLISLQRIDELRGIEIVENRIRIGALTTPKELASHPLIRKHLPALADAAKSMASPQIRSLATIGGNIAGAVPSADLPPTLMAADAAVQLVCSDSPREISLIDFFAGPRLTVCGAGEILTSIFIPVPSPETGVAYEKFVQREANSLAVASVAARLTLKDNVIEKAAIVLGAVAPTPLLATEASAKLEGKSLSDDILDQASNLAAAESKPISDVRGSLWFRTELLPVLTRRALARALERAQGEISSDK